MSSGTMEFAHCRLPTQTRSSSTTLNFYKTGQEYGPVYSVKLGSVNAVVITDAKILKKVLAKDETLERPQLYLLDRVFNRKGTRFRINYIENFTVIVGILMLPVDVWKDQHKFLIHFLRIIGASKVSPNKKTFEALIRKCLEEFVQVSELNRTTIL